MWFIGVEVDQETSAPPPKNNPGSAPGNIEAVHSNVVNGCLKLDLRPSGKKIGPKTVSKIKT